MIYILFTRIEHNSSPFLDVMLIKSTTSTPFFFCIHLTFFVFIFTIFMLQNLFTKRSFEWIRTHNLYLQKMLLRQTTSTSSSSCFSFSFLQYLSCLQQATSFMSDLCILLRRELLPRFPFFFLFSFLSSLSPPFSTMGVAFIGGSTAQPPS